MLKHVVFSVVAFLVGCSGAGSEFHEDAGHDAGADAPWGTWNIDGATDAGGGIDAACATASATPAAVPVSLVVMFDKSGSMAESSKWPSCTQGMEAFFEDPASKGLSASLQFFPQLPLGVECTVSSYSKPEVAMQPLPTTAFASAFQINKPGYGTPTLPALTGAIQYAQSQTTKSAVVLVTDGYPNDCASSVANVASEAAAGFAAGIPTFVIGLGSTTNLDAIAQAGGTKQATIVSTTSAQQTEQDFQTALATIRGLVLACDYAIPPLPPNTTLDQVNVLYTPTNGSPITLTYDQNCAAPNEWRYDDPKSPTKIELCPQTCGAVQSDASGKIEIVFGCSTQGGVPK
jgi:hypothetical protein